MLFWKITGIVLAIGTLLNAVLTATGVNEMNLVTYVMLLVYLATNLIINVLTMKEAPIKISVKKGVK